MALMKMSYKSVRLVYILDQKKPNSDRWLIRGHLLLSSCFSVVNLLDLCLFLFVYRTLFQRKIYFFFLKELWTLKANKCHGQQAKELATFCEERTSYKDVVLLIWKRLPYSPFIVPSCYSIYSQYRQSLKQKQSQTA